MLSPAQTWTVLRAEEGYLGYVVGDHLFPHSELSDYAPLYRWRFELTSQYTGSINHAL
jgi:hypothetical protein